jgi:uncharacterized protein YkwD
MGMWTLAACGSEEFPQTCNGVGSWPSETYEREVVRLVNVERAKGRICGSDMKPAVASLQVEGTLTCAARLHARYMATSGDFAHTTRDGTTFVQRAVAAGYTGFAAGENIAAGQRNPDDVMTAWLNSPGHCSGIMSDNSDIGVGFYDNYWVQVFGSSRP